MPSLAFHQVREEDDNPPGAPLQRQKAGVCGRPQVRRDGTSFELTMPATAGVGPQAAGHTSRQVSHTRMCSISR